MDIQAVLHEYDNMFATSTLQEVEDFLRAKIKEAVEEDDAASVFTLLNEIIGFCRDTTQREKGLTYCQSLMGLLDKMQLHGTVEYATSLLNIANAYRAFDKHEEALQLFEETEAIYRDKLSGTDFSFASLYNNWSLLYQEMQNYPMAKAMLLKALHVVDCYPEAGTQQAVTRTNLAVTIMETDEDNKLEQAESYLQEALAYYEKDYGKDFHYGAALVAMGDVCYKKQNYEEAAHYYQRGLLELEKHVGRTENYARVFEKFTKATQRCEKQNGWKSNLERSREFFERFGKKMLHEKFAAYEERIAVGVVGEGSDCFGFDDYVSSDHDYGLGFCMWLTEADYEAIGQPLQEAYEQLLEEAGVRNIANPLLVKRRGVTSINRFYNTLLGTDTDYENATDIFFANVKEFRLAHAVNGEVFADKAGVFSHIRSALEKYYPEHIWRAHLAKALHDFSQYAQSNYPRMMARADYVTANMCVAKATESAIDLVYLLNKTYAPYYKWKKKGMEKLTVLQDVARLLEKVPFVSEQSRAWEGLVYSAAVLNEKDAFVVLFEQIATCILKELKKQNLVTGDDTFLELYVSEVERQ